MRVPWRSRVRVPLCVSMKSGLRDRNNARGGDRPEEFVGVSMKSGLRDQNNAGPIPKCSVCGKVSMKSGLGDRNNGLLR